MPANDKFDFDEMSENVLREQLREAPSPAAQRTAAQRLLDIGHVADAQVLLRGAIHSARAERNVVVERQAMNDLARAVLHHSPRAALHILRGIKELSTTPSGLNLLGTIHHESYVLDRAERYFKEALACANNMNDNRFKYYVSANLASLRFEKGEYCIAGKLISESIEGLRIMGDVDAVAILYCNLACHELIRGNYEAAIQIMRGNRKEILSTSNSWVAGFRELIRGEIESATGDKTKALEHFTSAHSFACTATDAALQAKALAWKAVLSRGQDTGGVVRDLQGAAQDLFTRGLRSDSAFILLMTSKAAEANGIDGTHWAVMAQEILGEAPICASMASHYERIIRIQKVERRSTSKSPFRPFLSQSPRVSDIKGQLARLASTDVRLLIEGESGTGKSFLAGLVHKKGRGEKRPFIVVDCTNLEENLFESKLFGHMRGSFTGAVANTVGLVEQADGGTLFLDEIGELPLEIQAKLLYTIEEQRFRPVGARVEKRADFRVMAATNRDIDEMLENGTLRRDLYFRIAGYRVVLPPLRERREDIVPLAELQLERLNEKYGRRKVLRPGVWEIFARYDWPGNVRELNATLERGFHLASGRRIAVEDLGLGLSAHEAQIEDLTWDGIRRDHLLRVLRLCRGNVTRAAKILEMNRTTLIYKLKQLDIERSDFDPSYQETNVPAEEAADAPSLRMVADRGTETAPEEGTDGAE